MVHYDTDYESEFNVLTQNHFLPLRDMGDPNEGVYQPPHKVGNQGGTVEAYYGFNHGEYRETNQVEDYGQQNWGFPRPSLGIRRVVELREFSDPDRL